MCSYVTQRAAVAGSAKGRSGWFALTHATVYFDHPYHSPYEHTLNIDFSNTELGPESRVAVELTASSARELIACIEAALEAAGLAAA
ncbi:MAG: DUF6295 family protein [Acidimicrobiales bacterium]